MGLHGQPCNPSLGLHIWNQKPAGHLDMNTSENIWTSAAHLDMLDI
jgi:hypothetical protein